MPKLNVDQRTIINLFQDKKSDFLIPAYQRPYAWGENECQTLWDDIFTFAIPDEGSKEFDSNSEYFLGPIVTFKNKENKLEVIDGQQRLTTIMLLLRAFYSKFGHMQDKASRATKENIEKCLWKTDEFGEPNMNALKIDSEVATDNNKEEFFNILKTGNASKEQKSKYAENYRFFQESIQKFLDKYPTYFAYLPTRIMNNCILLPIEAESQDTALKIFSTLNNRGKPLSDSDIFKSELYKFYSDLGKKDQFIEKWKILEELCQKTFNTTENPMDELFTRYMFFIRAKKGIKSSTTESLRKFYATDDYAILKTEDTLNNIIDLANFWNDISNQDKDKFTQKTLSKLFVLNYAPNGMWTYFVSVYFMQNKDSDGSLEENQFCNFLDKITGFIWTFAITNPGVNALRTPIYTEMINLVNNNPITFADFKFDINKIRSAFSIFNFNNSRPITKSMVTWWAYQDENQELLPLETTLEIEHIYARSRQDKEKSLNNINNLESLGNKALLEKRINIRATDYRFEDKKKYYIGYYSAKKNQKKEGTKIIELINLANTKSDFTEIDIEHRTTKIINKFIEFLSKNGLTK